ncbi:MAG: Fic family protein [Candidatus Nanoarchaeia archaeon]|jgi:Fic family protein
MNIPEFPKEKLVSPNEIMPFLSDKKLMEIIKKFNEEYIPFEKLKRKVLPKEVNVEQLWTIMKIFRRSNYKTVKIKSYEFNYSLNDDFQSKIHNLDMSCGGKSLNINFPHISSQEKERYIISSLMEEAIASSQLEGASTTRKVAKEMLRSNAKPKSYSDKMILNNYNTMQEIVKMKDENLTMNMILKIHKLITKGTLESEKMEGSFRDTDEIVVGDPINIEIIYHHPPKNSEIKELIEVLCYFINNDSEFIHPIIKAIMLHFFIGYIHPFYDGNGRTARALFYWYIIKKGYWLFEYMSVSRIILRSKVDYGMAYLYTEHDENDLNYFIKYNIDCIEEAVKNTEEYILKKQREQRELLNIIQQTKGLNLRQAEIIKDAAKNKKPIIINEVINTFGVTYQTARTDLLGLEKKGFLSKIKIQKMFIFKLNEDKFKEIINK